LGALEVFQITDLRCIERQKLCIILLPERLGRRGLSLSNERLQVFLTDAPTGLAAAKL
jgi:hypothetical protein